MDLGIELPRRLSSFSKSTPQKELLSPKSGLSFVHIFFLSYLGVTLRGAVKMAALHHTIWRGERLWSLVHEPLCIPRVKHHFESCRNSTNGGIPIKQFREKCRAMPNHLCTCLSKNIEQIYRSKKKEWESRTHVNYKLLLIIIKIILIICVLRCALDPLIYLYDPALVNISSLKLK